MILFDLIKEGYKQKLVKICTDKVSNPSFTRKYNLTTKTYSASKIDADGKIIVEELIEIPVNQIGMVVDVLSGNQSQTNLHVLFGSNTVQLAMFEVTLIG